jgi:hypothetical protein
MGIAFTVTSLAVLGLYSEATFTGNSKLILSFVLIFVWSIWSSNLWIDVERGRLKYDPVRHALKDLKSRLALAVMLGAYLGFNYGGWIE